MPNKRIRTDVDSPVNEVADSVTEKLVFVEVFAGSAKLSKAADQRGFKALPVDYSQNKHRPQHDILIMDLSDPTAQSQLMQTLEDDVPCGLHMAPPCGTCSRARERPLPHLGDSTKTIEGRI